MSERDELHALLDGELSEREARELQKKIAESPELQQKLESLMRFDAITSVAAEEARLNSSNPSAKVVSIYSSSSKAAENGVALVSPDRSKETDDGGAKRSPLIWGPWRALGAPLAVAALIGVVLAGLYLGETRPVAELDTYFTQVGRRHARVRLTTPEADVYRPYNPFLSARGGSGEIPPHQLLAALEEKAELRAITAIYLLGGNPGLAESALSKAPGDIDADTDRAAVAIEQGEYKRAVRLLDSVLRRAPKHPQALWNRGLALEGLGLRLAAAESFRSMAKVDVTEWASAATSVAETLERDVDQWRQAWYRAKAAGKRMVATGQPVEPKSTERFPGVIRLYFYDAIRSVGTATGAEALLGVAKTLDRHYQTQRLQALVTKTSELDFTVRGPLAARYRRLALGDRLSSKALEGLLQDARSKGHQDILLGAMYLGFAERKHVDEFTRIAEGLQDPWFETLAVAVRSDVAKEAGRLDRALRLLLAAHGRSTVDYRTAHLELLLVRQALKMHRLPIARSFQAKLEARIRRTKEWSQDLKMLQLQGRLHVFEDDIALAKIYLREAVLREPKRCGLQRFVRETLTMGHLFENRVQEAWEVASEWGTCRGQLTDIEALAWVDLSRRSKTPVDQVFLEKQLHRLVKRAREPGNRLFAQAALGQWEIQRSEVEGQKRLREVIEVASSRPSWDGQANRARSLAHLTLAAHAGADGRFEEAVRMLAERVGTKPPTKCGLGLYVEDERHIAVAVGADGVFRGYFSSALTSSPTEIEADKLVPKTLLGSFRGCEEVRVVTHSPMLGRPGVLPREIAWSYAVGQSSPKQSGGTPRRLIVADVEAAPELGLPPLPAYGSVDDPKETTVLRGHLATRRNVLKEMVDATEIEFYTHGFHDLGSSDAAMLILTPEGGDLFALTGADVASVKLTQAPVVLLTACQSAKAVGFRHNSYSLPVTFLSSGARAVVAANTPIPANRGRAFFQSVRELIAGGKSPAVAARDTRAAMQKGPKDAWMESILVFGH